MSVINQVLLDLEKRRASGAERKALPNHVRVMPAAASGRGAWLAVPTVAALAAAAWVGLQAIGGTTPRAVPAAAFPETPVAAPVAPEPVAATLPEMQAAARLSFELSRLPDPVPEPPTAARAIPAARVIAKPAGAEPVAVQTRAEPAAAFRGNTSESATTRPRGAATEVAPAPVAVPEKPRAEIDKRMREPTARELAEADYRKATALLHQGRLAEAGAGFESALARNPAHHAARQALLGVLVESGRVADAERVMREGLQISPHQIGFAMALARLQVDRGDAQAAIATLQEASPHAQNSGDYLAFLAGLLQRERRHDEAVEQFQAALRLRPGNGVWLLGLGMSLQALGRDAAAREAFRLARSSPGLSGDLQAFAEQRLRQLQ